MLGRHRQSVAGAAMSVGGGTASIAGGSVANVAPHRGFAADAAAESAAAAAAAGAGSQFFEVNVQDDDGGIEMKQSIHMLYKAINLREKYVNMMHGAAENLYEKLQPPIALKFEDGIMMFTNQTTVPVPWETYYEDIMELSKINSDSKCNASSRFRLHVLEEKFNIHRVLNSNIEDAADPLRRIGGGGVFAQIFRVDNNVRLAASMSAMHLLKVIQELCELRNLDTVRYNQTSRGVESVTLRDLMNSMSLEDPSKLTVESLGLHPPSEKRFSRFDPLDPEVNRGGGPTTDLLKAFLTRETAHNGRLFAEVVRPVVYGVGSGPTGGMGGGGGAALSGQAGIGGVGGGGGVGGATSSPLGLASGDAGTGTNSVRAYESAEFSIPVHGSSEDEWEQVAKWVVQNKLLSPYNRVMYTIEIPRIAARRGDFRHQDQLKQLECLFTPLFVATLSPEDPKCQDIDRFLSNVGAFIITSDEDTRSSDFPPKRRTPRDLPWSENPCDLWFAYYIWANLVSLNAFRKRKRLNTFQLRFAAGERSTQLDSAMLSYLLCDNISHGVVLGEHPVLQYLYGFHKIGICMSPLTNNAMDIAYVNNPFPAFFRRGLTITLCSDSPLHHHHHDRALLEEYGTASKIYKLAAVDMAEIARTSVLMSSFDNHTKLQFLGDHYCDVRCTGVPLIRLNFRDNCWAAEKQLITALRVRAEGGVFSAGSGIVVTGANNNTNSLDGTFGNMVALDGTLSGTVITSAGALAGAFAAAAAAGDNNNNNNNTAASAMSGDVDKGDGGGDGGEDGASCARSKANIRFARLRLSGPVDRDPLVGTAAGSLHRSLKKRLDYVWNSSSEHRMGTILARLKSSAGGGGAGAGAGAAGAVMSGGGINASSGAGSAFEESAWGVAMVEGVFVNHGRQNIPRHPDHLPKYSDFATDIAALRTIVDNRIVKTLAFRRLNLLEHKYRLHHAVSHSTEAGATEQKLSQNRDFYQTTKVDTSVRMETGMTSRQLLDFIIQKAQNSGDDIVSVRSGEEPQTLRQLLQQLNINPAHLTVDDLNVQADGISIARVSQDQFRQEGRDALLNMLLKTDNEMNGRYFAELTRLTFDQFQRDRYTFAENRLTVYGAKPGEWDRLSKWFDTHGMACYNNQWMIQFPRIYSHLRKKGVVNSFSTYLTNLFGALWEVSLHPANAPRLFHFLNHVSGFDCIEDERVEGSAGASLDKLPPPHKWTRMEDPPYNYYCYYIWINIRTLNEFRALRNFSTYSFRPSCGEGGNKDHLLGGFLLANAINYGVALADDPAIQYLFYLSQIGISLSPLSNNTKFLEYLNNPFPAFFRRGLNVSLSTDSPLTVHHTQEPLIEEYSVASKVWKLTPTDMCEIARSSVLQSGFSHEFKQRALGKQYFLSSERGNDNKVTHLSDVRLAYRYETYHQEVDLLQSLSGMPFPRTLFTDREEESLITLIRQHSKNTAEAAKSGIIAASTDEQEISRMKNQQTILFKQLGDAESQLDSLKLQNRKLFDSLNEAVAREAQLEHSKQTIQQMVEAAGKRMARSRGGGKGGLSGGGGDSSASPGIASSDGVSTSPAAMSITGGSATPSGLGSASSAPIANSVGAGGDLLLSSSGRQSVLSRRGMTENDGLTVPATSTAAAAATDRAAMIRASTKAILEGSEAIFGRDSLFR